MLAVLLQGFLLGLAYVAPIGMQNVYVINNGLTLSKRKAYMVAFIIAFFDITLAFACFYGIGFIMEQYNWIRYTILLLGSIAMFIIGFQLIKTKDNLDLGSFKKQSIKTIIITSMVVTWFNPQAIIDGTLLLGGFRATLTEFSEYFILGVSIASLSWFLIVTTLVTSLKHAFNNKVIRIINIVCGTAILFFGFKLLYTFITTI